MNTELILEWLQLPAGPWPPETRTLLGLPSHPVSLAEAEQKALDRMELLRPHQLRHPELVTEGMNRLAQALLQFTGSIQEVPEPLATVVLDAEVLDVNVVEFVPKKSSRRRKPSSRPNQA